MSLLYTFRRIFRPTDRTMHPFDRAHRVDTSGLLYPDQLTTGDSADARSEGYYATAPSLFHAVIAMWRRQLTRPLSSYRFVDLGCGKGRALLMASLYPFRSVTGIELHPKLAEAARSNAARWLRTQRACSNIEVITGDATAPVLESDEPVVLFLFNSFDAEAVARLMRNLTRNMAREARSAPVDLLYLHPEQHATVMAVERILLLGDVEIPLSAEDTEADAFHVTSDRCTVYRLGN